jgi:hypothetical protein
MDLANDPLPLSPEDWVAVVNDAVAATGHGDEVVVAVETTIDGWKVTVNPVRNATPAPGPESS